MRPVLASAVVALAALASAPVWAQSAPTASQAGLRQLGWPGKAEERAAAPAGQAPVARARPAQPNRYSARTGTAQPVWNPFPEIAPAAANLRPVQRPAAYPAAPQPWRPPVVQQPAPVLRAAPQPLTPPLTPPVAAPMRQAGPAIAAPSPAGSRLRQPPGAPMSVARPDRELAAPPQRPAAQPAAPARPATQPTGQVAAPPFAPAPLMPAPASQAAVTDPAPPRSYADFSRPMGSPPAATAAPAAAVADAVDAPPRSYADFSRPMSSPPVVQTPGQPVSATGGEGPRYYSLHREYGRQPDHPEIPEAVYLDSLGSEDLAAPPPPLPSDRDERRARAAAADPDAPSGN